MHIFQKYFYIFPKAYFTSCVTIVYQNWSTADKRALVACTKLLIRNDQKTFA